MLPSCVPLGPLPWLHRLRARSPRFVRQLHCCRVGGGAPGGAGLRPPPKLDVQISRIQLSQMVSICSVVRKEWEQVTLSTIESTFLAPFRILQSASLLGQSGFGFFSQGTFLLLDFALLSFWFCPSAFVCRLSQPTPGCRRLAVERLSPPFFGTIRQSDHSPCVTPRFALDLSDRLCRAVCATTRRVLLGSCSILPDRAARTHLVAMG